MREIKSSQPRLRRMNVNIDGTAGTPSASGDDKYLVESVADNATGDYTITLNGKAMAKNGNNLTVLSTQIIDGVGFVSVVATTNKTVNVNCFDVDGTTPKDLDFTIEVQANDNKFLTGF